MRLERLPDAVIPSDLAEHMNAIMRNLPNLTSCLYKHPHDWQRLVRAVVNVAELAPTTLLEIGCAEGYMTGKFAEIVPSIHAVDYSREVLARCPPRPNVRYEHHDIEQWTPEETYDVITITEVLEHLRDPQAVIAKLIPRCKYLLASCPISEPLNYDTFDDSLVGHEVKPGDASGHIHAMDMEGFLSWFAPYHVVHSENIQGVNGLVVASQ